ncbi:class I adenylate-forming enzyme family protein [Variovorax sp. J31P179]|uniref:class I adenylate-forming enzyme family protein n=1 Tax=Variovorax sp. J31P179 TaxID=3053508 RepID=UPI002577944A|nr:class I adenylate-forming enzyme family protein [Variovorax sp. J31P179]MDM0084731.1 class I adenylate-forming enzyme family protein [Variovorax sp. J31P179]
MTTDELKFTIDRVARERSELGIAIQREMASAKGMTFTAFLRRRARAWPSRTALVFGQRSLTYGELLDCVDRAREVLKARGVQQGQSVAFLVSNSDHYVVWYLAVLGVGAVAVPLNNRLVPREAAYILKHSESVLLVTEPSFDGIVSAVSADHGVSPSRIVLDVQDASCGLGEGRFTGEPDIKESSPAALYYTSGTTGQPKGVVHTHGTLIVDALQSPDAWEFNFPEGRTLAVTPLFHIAAHTIFYPVFFLGGTLIVDSYNTEATLRLIQSRRINAFFGVPSILLLMVEKAKALGITLDLVRTVMFGAAPMAIAKLGEVQALFPNASLVHGMGQTESGGTLVTLPGVLAIDRAGSVGMAMAGVEVAIFGESDEKLPAGTVGELVARGPNVMQGYYRNPDATHQALRGGWLHTGDLGFQDDDGLVTLVDRKKDMIIRGGENIYSSEVEQVLLEHPAVKVAVVVGQQDSLFGEQVAAFVVVDANLPPPPATELADHCRRSLADYKIPVTFQFLSEVPLTATGKVMKAELRKTLGPYQRGGATR